MPMPHLYLISLPIEENATDHIPPVTALTLKGLQHFIVEKVRTARRFIRKIDREFDIDGSHFVELDKKDWSLNIRNTSPLLQQKVDIGLMSESGSPCVADPGHQIVGLARRAGYTVVPISGPSSIILSLMASGLNGQQFTFHGYLPIKEPELKKRLKEIDHQVRSTGYTQLWIETPYRNQAMYNAILSTCHPSHRLSIASDITAPSESIRTYSIADWRKEKVEWEKVPTIFLLGS